MTGNVQTAVQTVEPRNVVSMPGHSAGLEVSTPSKAPAKTLRTLVDLKVDQAAENIMTYIAEGDVITGTLAVKGGARIAGMVTGSLICSDGSAVIEDTGVVNGSVSATKRVIIAGKVGHGEDDSTKDVSCPEDVIILGTGKVAGNVYYGNLATYDRGEISGRIQPFANR